LFSQGSAGSIPVLGTPHLTLTLSGFSYFIPLMLYFGSMNPFIVLAFLFIFPFTVFGQTPSIHLENGVKYYEHEDYKNAIKEFSKLIELQPKNASAYNNRGMAKLDLEDYHGAIADFTKAIQINTKYAKAYCNRGSAKMELKDYKNAILDFDKAISLNPKYGKAYNNRGLAKCLSTAVKSGCLDFSKAVELGNDNAYDNIKLFCK
jgi:tetratricopeptide (TPR) repeat protein